MGAFELINEENNHKSNKSPLKLSKKTFRLRKQTAKYGVRMKRTSTLTKSRYAITVQFWQTILYFILLF